MVINILKSYIILSKSLEVLLYNFLCPYKSNEVSDAIFWGLTKADLVKSIAVPILIFLAGWAIGRLNDSRKEYKKLKDFKNFVIAWSETINKDLLKQAEIFKSESNRFLKYDGELWSYIGYLDVPFKELNFNQNVDLTKSLALRAIGNKSKNMRRFHEYFQLLRSMEIYFLKAKELELKALRDINMFIKESDNQFSVMNNALDRGWEEGYSNRISPFTKEFNQFLRDWGNGRYNRLKNRAIFEELIKFKDKAEQKLELKSNINDFNIEINNYLKLTQQYTDFCEDISANYSMFGKLLIEYVNISNCYLKYFASLKIINHYYFEGLNFNFFNKKKKYSISDLEFDLKEVLKVEDKNYAFMYIYNN